MQTASVQPPQSITENERRMASDREPAPWQPIALTMAVLVAGVALMAIALAIAG